MGFRPNEYNAMGDFAFMVKFGWLRSARQAERTTVILRTDARP